MIQDARTLIDAFSILDEKPLLLTNNIFAVDDTILCRWPGVRVVGVLGEWALEQYLRARLPGNMPADVVVIPNGQDTEVFRPPSELDRKLARARCGFAHDERVLLRIGSPHRGKWSTKYGALVEARGPRDRFVFIGPPLGLISDVPEDGPVDIIRGIGDDDELRAYYWAADLFVHDSARGESFGNVITEALLSGLPVVYRGHPFRDNTPWEFADIQGFRYCSSVGEWVSASQSFGRPDALVDVGAVRQRYGLRNVACMLDGIAAGTLYRADGRPRRSKLGGLERAAVLIRHNPALTVLKNARLRYM